MSSPPAFRKRVVWAAVLALLAPLGAVAEPVERPSLLLLDLNLTAPQVHTDLRTILGAAGYAVTDRPGDPQLVRRDFRSYNAIMLLAGNTPTLPGAMLGRRALGPLADFVKSGGVLFLGAPANPMADDAGEHERMLYNTLLRRLRIPIVIQKGWVTKAAAHYPAVLYDAPWFAPVPGHQLTEGLPDRMPLPRMAPLQVGSGATVLVTSLLPDHAVPVLAMGRRGKGLVVVASRAFFNPTGAYQIDVPLLEDPDGLAARRLLFERIAVYAAGWRRNRGAGGSVVPAVEAIQMEPSSGARAAWLRSLPGRYRWIVNDGIRAGWVHVDRDAPFQRMVRWALVESRLNLLWGSTDAELLAAQDRSSDQRQLLTQWARMDQLLRGTGVRWFMGSHYPGAHAALSDYPPALGAQGQTIGGMSPVDRRFWEREIFPVLRAEAEFSATHPSVAGLMIDLEMYQLTYWYFTNGFDFGDAAFDLYRQELDRRGEAGPAARARALGATERFDWLVEQGQLEDYWTVLMQEAERIGRALREEIYAINPRLMLGFYAAAVPTGWFYEGLLRGASDPEQPVLLFTFQRAPAAELERAFHDGLYLLHGSAILLGQAAKADIGAAITARLARDQGYWLNNIATLATEDAAQHRRSRIESPRDGSAEDYIRAIAEANKSYKGGSRR